MTVADAFRTTLDALFKAQDRTPADLTRTTGISSATWTRLLDGTRGASFPMLEEIRLGFGVTAAELFDPDRALAQIGLIRAETARSENRPVNSSLAHDEVDHLVSDSSNLLKESDLPDDPVLFRKLRAYWEAMEPSQHAKLVVLAWELSNPGVERPPVGFKRG